MARRPPVLDYQTPFAMRKAIRIARDFVLGLLLVWLAIAFALAVGVHRHGSMAMNILLAAGIACWIFAIADRSASRRSAFWIGWATGIGTGLALATLILGLRATDLIRW